MGYLRIWIAVSGAIGLHAGALSWGDSATARAPVVAIDPGHGGAHGGAEGVCGVMEDDVALGIAVELAKILRESRRATPVLTRTGDVEVPLEERPAKANAAGAVLLLSIHANASKNPTARGAETFFLSRRAATRRSATLAMRENAGRALITHGPTAPLDEILASLTLNAVHGESQRFAMRLQQELSGQVTARSRGVLQAPFVVLYGARMAAALVEVGFLTHPEECQWLADTVYRRRIAGALAAAILAHLRDDAARLAKAAGPARGTARSDRKALVP